MKKAEDIKPNNGPVYAAAMYPELAKIFIDHGYALAVHGSLARDLDLIAIPWIDNPKTPDEIIQAILKEFAVTLVNKATKHPHGRIVYTLSIGWGNCFMDLGFMPALICNSPLELSPAEKCEDTVKE